MNWKAVVDAADYGSDASSPLKVALDSGRAFDAGTLTPDVLAEQEKLLWADTIIFQFPLWWYTMPAILKGWVDRVFTYHFAYGVGEHSDTKYGERFGEGTLAGRKALLSVTAGGPESHYAARGINGPIDDLLFPIHHGILYYPGFDVLPPYLVYRTHKVDETAYARITEELGQRLDTLFTTEPIPFRPQNAGDYDIPALTLRPDIAPGQAGFAVHSAPRADRE
jgi:NAD(P)H dehydrogenase (quinone)